MSAQVGSGRLLWAEVRAEVFELELAGASYEPQRARPGPQAHAARSLRPAETCVACAGVSPEQGSKHLSLILVGARLLSS